MKKEGVLRQFGKFLKPYAAWFIAAIAFLISAAVLNAQFPRLEGLILTRLTENFKELLEGTGTGVDFQYVIKIIVILFIVYTVQSLCSYFNNFIMAHAIQGTVRDLRNAVEEKIHALPVSYFDQNSTGDLLSRVTNDVEAVSTAMQQSVGQVLQAVLTLSLAVVMMFMLHIPLACIAVLIIPISIVATKFIVGKSQKHFTNQQNALGDLNGYVEEMISGFNEVILYNKQEDAVEEFKAKNNVLYQAGFQAQFISSLMSPLISFVTYLGIGTVAIAGAFYTIVGQLTVGNLQAFVRYIWQINQPLSEMTHLSSSIQSAYAALTRIFDFLNAEEMTETGEAAIEKEVKGDVTFDHVRFGYGDKVVIQDFSIEVKSGSMVAIVGPTGAGKTTLINLLMRFYDVQSGAIRIDGMDTKDMKREELRKIFGMVLQDTWLFQGTIADNIRYGNRSASRAEVIQAAKVANVHHFIKTLPGDYNMVINEEASNISVGEKQLLTIARAILADPPILILDEATSSVDTRLEMMLQTAMRNVMKGRTSFVIAHRLSTVRNADMILVVKDGDIVEKGTHDELMLAGGFYESLYSSQFQEE